MVWNLTALLCLLVKKPFPSFNICKTRKFSATIGWQANTINFEQGKGLRKSNRFRHWPNGWFGNLKMESWFWILGWILSILTIAGNGFIIFLVCNKRQLRTKTNAFIVSLAVADFSVGASVVPFFFVCDMEGSCRDWPAPVPLCTYVIRWLFGYASVINLCGLVLERYIAVVKPFKYLTVMTNCRVIQMIIFSWAIPLVFVIVLLFMVMYNVSISMFINLFTLLVEFVSCSVITFCFVAMLRVVYKQDRVPTSLGKVSRFSQHRDKSAIVMMTIVVALFLICYSLYLRCSFAGLLNLPCDDLSYKIPLLILNSAINPWAYALFKRDIRTMVKRLICRETSRNNNSVMPIILANRSAVGTQVGLT